MTPHWGVIKPKEITMNTTAEYVSVRLTAHEIHAIFCALICAKGEGALNEEMADHIEAVLRAAQDLA